MVSPNYFLYVEDKVVSAVCALRSVQSLKTVLGGGTKKPPVTLFYCICVIDTTNYKIRLDLESKPGI